MNIKSAVLQDKCYCNAYLEVTSQTSNTNIQQDKQFAHTYTSVYIKETMGHEIKVQTKLRTSQSIRENSSKL